MQERWVEAVIVGSPERRWLPVFRAECEAHSHVLGVTPSGNYVEGSGDPVVLSDKSAVRFLFLLEHRLDEVRSAVEEALTAAGLRALPVPVSTVVAAALRGRMEYWAALAASWLEQDRGQYPELETLIADVVRSRWASQGTRHLLRQFMQS